MKKETVKKAVMGDEKTQKIEEAAYSAQQEHVKEESDSSSTKLGDREVKEKTFDDVVIKAFKNTNSNEIFRFIEVPFSQLYRIGRRERILATLQERELLNESESFIIPEHYDKVLNFSDDLSNYDADNVIFSDYFPAIPCVIEYEQQKDSISYVRRGENFFITLMLDTTRMDRATVTVHPSSDKKAVLEIIQSNIMSDRDFSSACSDTLRSLSGSVGDVVSMFTKKDGRNTEKGAKGEQLKNLLTNLNPSTLSTLKSGVQYNFSSQAVKVFIPKIVAESLQLLEENARSLIWGDIVNIVHQWREMYAQVPMLTTKTVMNDIGAAVQLFSAFMK